MSSQLSKREQEVLDDAKRKYKQLLQQQQQGGASLNEFVRRITSNRVLELYLKYLGLTTLNSVTLVPFALLLGRDYFQQYLMKKSQRGGGELIPRKIPFVDNAAIGTFLVLAGIPLVGLNANTLVPLGVLMIVYEMANKLSGRSSSKRSSKRGRSRSRSMKGGDDISFGAIPSGMSDQSIYKRKKQSDSMNGGDGSAFATTLSAVDANAPWQRTYEQCLPFARQSECAAAAKVARSIQDTINPGVTNAMRGGRRSSKRSSKRSQRRSSKRRSQKKLSKRRQRR
jgi:hypothetical protein